MATRNLGLSGHGAKLRELRVKRGLSLRTLATRTGFSPTFISRLEADAVSPSLASLVRIADELGPTLDQLFTSSDIRTPDGHPRWECPGYESARSRDTAGV